MFRKYISQLISFLSGNLWFIVNLIEKTNTFEIKYFTLLPLEFYVVLKASRNRRLTYSVLYKSTCFSYMYYRQSNNKLSMVWCHLQCGMLSVLILHPILFCSSLYEVPQSSLRMIAYRCSSYQQLSKHLEIMCVFQHSVLGICFIHAHCMNISLQNKEYNGVVRRRKACCSQPLCHSRPYNVRWYYVCEWRHRHTTKYFV